MLHVTALNNLILYDTKFWIARASRVKSHATPLIPETSQRFDL